MIELKKAVLRISGAQDAGRPIIVGMEPPNLLTFRLFRTRKTYRLPVAAAYQAAVRCELLAKMRERRLARKARKS